MDYIEGWFGYASLSCSHTGSLVDERFQNSQPKEDQNDICPETGEKITSKKNGVNVKIVQIGSFRNVLSFRKIDKEIKLTLCCFARHDVS